MNNIFTKHPHSVGETYFQHLGVALKSGLLMILAGIICFVHAAFPFLFSFTASTIITKLANKFNARKNIPPL